MMLSSKACLTFLALFPSALSFLILPESTVPDNPRLQKQSHSKEAITLPLVIWHGLGDNFEADGLKSVVDYAEEINPGTFTYIIRLGDGTGGSDRSATFFGNLTEQLADVCEQLANHQIIGTAPAINAMGFSQGGQFLRGYVQRCNSPPVYNLLTFGSQHNGISEFQSCGATDWTCKAANALLRSGTWSNFVQSRLVPAQYFRDPQDLDPYLENSNWLADINNERRRDQSQKSNKKENTYAKNLSSLHKFVMYLFANDKTVVPRQSGWFSEVNRTEPEHPVITPLRDRPIYKEDWIGLKKLDEKGGLVFDEVEGEHMQLKDKDLKKAFEKYFAPVDEEDLNSWLYARTKTMYETDHQVEEEQLEVEVEEKKEL